MFVFYTYSRFPPPHPPKKILLMNEMEFYGWILFWTHTFMTCVAVHDELITIPCKMSKSQISGILRGQWDFEIPGDPNLFSH